MTPDAFADLVALHQRRLFGLLLMIVRDPAAAEELAQDAFVRAFTRIDRYDASRPFYPWLSTIAVRLAQNWLVSRTRRRAREGAEMPVEPAAADAVDPLGDLIAGEADRALWQQVSALPVGERTAVLAYYRHEMSVEEIAGALGVTAGTVKTMLFRARRKLREQLTSVATAALQGARS